MPAAHDQDVVHKYRIHYPDHAPRVEDPHYPLFEAYRRTHVSTAICAVGSRGTEFLADCKGGLELHHRVIEFAIINEVDLATFIKDYPKVTNAEELANWAESEPNFVFLCMFHHRGHAGVHVASASDWGSEQYVPGLLT